jgi:hypothetical protein
MLETYYCCGCLTKIVAPSQYIKCKCGHPYIFWASYEKNGWGHRPYPLSGLPQELIDIIVKEEWLK